MSYIVDFTPEALDDAEALIQSLSEDRWSEAEDGLGRALESLGIAPALAAKNARLGRPEFRFTFSAGGVRYHWAATFCFGQDEQTIYVTHIYRTPL